VEPEAPASIVFNEIIVARRAGRLMTPPFAGDALRSLGMGDAMHLAAPTEPLRRSFRNRGNDIGRLGFGEEKERAGPPVIRFRPGVFGNGRRRTGLGPFRDVAGDRLQLSDALR